MSGEEKRGSFARRPSQAVADLSAVEDAAAENKNEDDAPTKDTEDNTDDSPPKKELTGEEKRGSFARRPSQMHEDLSAVEMMRKSCKKNITNESFGLLLPTVAKV